MSKGTDRRTVRVAPELWEAARAVALANDEPLSLVIRDALWEYVMESGQYHQAPDGSLQAGGAQR